MDCFAIVLQVELCKVVNYDIHELIAIERDCYSRLHNYHPKLKSCQICRRDERKCLSVLGDVTRRLGKICLAMNMCNQYYLERKMKPVKIPSLPPRSVKFQVQDTCDSCGKSLRFFRQRHHCRFCGCTICRKCQCDSKTGTKLSTISHKHERCCRGEHLCNLTH